jgi:2-keto-4-pentenoate hydratase/2-oxohepta-3-ene-1,7-dioic acid hydratase in catechol pathway
MEPGISWSLVTYCLDGRDHAGVMDGRGTVLAVPELEPYGGVLDAVADWDRVAPGLRELDPGRGTPVPGASLVAPLRYPGKLICAGANYASHVAEMGVSLDGRDEIKPYFFLLPATSTVVGPGEPVRIPAGYDAQVDWEAELAVVIGRRGHRIATGDAAGHVAGYTILNDLSARATHRRTDALAPPFEWDWLASKGLDTFCPMGPGLAPEWLVGDPHELHIKLWVNDSLKQDTPTSDMINGVWELIAAASNLMTLEPGDVIATGSPPGVGKPRGEFLSAGDRVRIEIPRVGRLENPIEMEAA